MKEFYKLLCYVTFFIIVSNSMSGSKGVHMKSDESLTSLQIIAFTTVYGIVITPTVYVIAWATTKKKDNE